GGAVRSNARRQVQELVRATGAPMVTTLPARGIVPDSDPAVLGMPGMHGTVAANGAIQHSDLLVAVGTRFDDRVTGSLEDFAPVARVIHIDIDPAEIGKNRQADVPIVGDVGQVLDDLIPALKAAQRTWGKPDLKPWWRLIDGWRHDYPTTFEPSPDGTLAPQWVVQTLSNKADPDTIWVSGVGQHQMWASQFIDFERTRSWVSSCGLGTMGYGLPAAIGTAIGTREEEDPRPVWLIDGDGSFQMTSEELATAGQAGLPIRIAILNNSVYGMVRQWQTLFYGSHYSQTNLEDGGAKPTDGNGIPDFVKLAEAYGCLGLRAFTQEQALEAIDKANAVTDRPVLIDFRVWKDAMVWPMVPAGASNDTIIYKPGVQPLAGIRPEQEQPEPREQTGADRAAMASDAAGRMNK
ncbi:MAG: thiamine pyrophosphate-dependent enzyme, partial [Bifidobacterium sp.]|nr:thiamine pyrophosphate-dependent enzyme [Bifidobacterium sp.]